jgi:protein-S-isoprenylcysteine O-methyltransferase Ste14
MNDAAVDHFGQWGNVVLWIGLYAIMLLFVPFYKKSERKPASAYIAFVVALAFEMFGIPLSMYALTWALGIDLPDGVLFGHTLNQWIGPWGMYVGTVMMLIGFALIVLGWRVIHKRYWSKDAGSGELVTSGIYRYIRHPQYTGFMLITLGMIFDWATLPLLIMWPILLVIYYRLARREEGMMEAEFGDAYRLYKARTGMFLPRLFKPAPEPALPRSTHAPSV